MNKQALQLQGIIDLTFDASELEREVFLNRFVELTRTCLWHVGITSIIQMVLQEIFKNIWDHTPDKRGYLKITYPEMPNLGTVIQMEIGDFGTESHDLEKVSQNGYTTLPESPDNRGRGMAWIAGNLDAQGDRVTWSVDASSGFKYKIAYRIDEICR